MNFGWLLLFAAKLEDFIFPLVVILFLIISAVGQVLGKIREAQQAQQRPRGGPAPRPGGVRPNVPPAHDPVRGEVEDFLRDAAQRRAVRGPQQAAPPRPTQPPVPGWRASMPPQPVPAPRPVEVELAELVPEDDASVADHVRRRLPAQEFGSLRPEVGTGLSQTAEAIEEHLHEVFDHRLGKLGDTPGESPLAVEAEEAETPEDRITPVPATAAAGLAAMLADPGSLRQAIVLNEILQRPLDRWE